jgi:ABC-2 type transport system permease protein
MTALESGRPSSWRSIRAVLWREFLDIRRDRRSLFLTFLYPITMLVLYGYGIRYDVDNVPLSVLDHSETPESRALVEQMTRSRYFRVVRWAQDERQVAHDLHTEAVCVALVIPQDFADRIRAGKETPVQVLIDGSDSNTATIAQGYALAVVQGFAESRSSGRANAPPIRVASRVWYNPELKSVNFIVPGMIAVIMMIVGALLTSISIVKEKERGTIEQILVSPIRPMEMIVGKIIPYVVIAVIDLAIIVVAGYVVFAVPIKGSLLDLSIFSLLYLISSLGLGVYVSTIVDNMQTALITAVFLSLLPSILLSGFVFPIEYMPTAIQWITYLFPGRYFVDAIRGIYLKSVGFSVLWPDALFLSLFAVGIVLLSAARFQQRLG